MCLCAGMCLRVHECECGVCVCDTETVTAVLDLTLSPSPLKPVREHVGLCPVVLPEMEKQTARS